MTRAMCGVLGVLLSSVVACGVRADGPPEIEVDRTPCAHCGMLVSEIVFAAAYRAPGGEPRVFDDIGCLLAAARREGNPGALRFWFHDAATGEWIAGTEAAFVKSPSLRTPMNGGLLAYRGAAAAGQAATRYEGRVIPTLDVLIGGKP